MSVTKKIQSVRIEANVSMLLAMKKMDATGRRLLLVFKENQFLNILSIGDIQRAILKNFPLETPIIKILRKSTKMVKEGDSMKEIKKVMKDFRIECMPVVSDDGKLVDVHFWEDIFGHSYDNNKKKVDLPVVIMAGGKGTRLRPLTNVMPKPLLPIGQKTISEEIMDRFVAVGCNHFYLSLNYKSDTIKQYFSDLKDERYNINYFQEEKPLGTAGSLFLIKQNIKTTFFVTNCDIIIDEDYIEILQYHKQNNNELTIVSAIKDYQIPYGTINTIDNGELDSLHEKPNFTFQINTGFYILEPHLLQEIPENEFFHITALIDKIKKRGGKVGVFPVSEGAWKDIGSWGEYIKLIR